MKNLDKLIEEHLIKYAQTTGTFDKYGQHPVHDMQIGRFIPAEHIQAVNKWLRSGKSKKFRLSCYGNSVYTYYAIDIIDESIRQKFSQCLMANPAKRKAVSDFFNN